MAEINSVHPQVIGRIILNIVEGGNAQLHVEGPLGKWTVYNALKAVTESFPAQMLLMEQSENKVMPAPPGFDGNKLRG